MKAETREQLSVLFEILLFVTIAYLAILWLAGLAGCTIRYVQPEKISERVDTVFVLNAKEAYSVDSRIGLRELLRRTLDGDQAAYTAYLANRRNMAEHLINSDVYHKDFFMRTLARVVGQVDTLDVTFNSYRMGYGTIRLVPDSADGWMESPPFDYSKWSADKVYKTTPAPPRLY